MSTTQDTDDATAPAVEMYSSQWCPFCRMAGELLADKGVAVTVHSVDGAPGVRAEMQQRSGRHTVPQVFVGGHHVGGCDDLHALDARGGLDPLLSR